MMDDGPNDTFRVIMSGEIVLVFSILVDRLNPCLLSYHYVLLVLRS